MPTEVERFLDLLDQHHQAELPPARRAELVEIQRQRRAGVLRAAPSRNAARHRQELSAAVAFVRAVIRTTGLLLGALACFTLAGAAVARPLGLVVAGLGLLYLEHRAEGSGRR